MRSVRPWFVGALLISLCAPGAARAEDDELLRALAEDAAAAPDPAPAPRAAGPGGGANAPDISVITDVAGAWFSDEDHLQSGAHDPRKTGFNLQQVEMAISGAVDPYFRYDAFLVFGQFGVELEEAYATTLQLPWNLQVRAGQFLTRFGRLNATHPHAWDFVDQPFAIGRVFGSEGNRGLGFETSWLAPIPWYAELLVSFTDAAGEATARSFFGGQDLGIVTPLDVQTTVALKQFFELGPDLSLLAGLSGAAGPNPTGHRNRSEVAGVDLYLKVRPITRGGQTHLTLQTEWLYRRRQIPEDVLADVTGYAQTVWRFDLRWAVGARYEYGGPARTRAGRAGEDYLDPAWTDHRHRGTANLTFWPTEFSRIRLQGSLDAPRWRDAPIGALFLALEVVAGAHGAHAF